MTKLAAWVVVLLGTTTPLTETWAINQYAVVLRHNGNQAPSAYLFGDDTTAQMEQATQLAVCENPSPLRLFSGATEEAPAPSNRAKMPQMAHQ